MIFERGGLEERKTERFIERENGRERGEKEIITKKKEREGERKRIEVRHILGVGYTKILVFHEVSILISTSCELYTSYLTL